jgi:hypothetical protein
VDQRAPERNRRPDFLVIGAMKAATTSLYHYLSAHPDIYMATVKELDFFVASANWNRGVGWYEKQFEAAGDAAVAGEASTAYTKHPIVTGVPERIATVVPDCRMIYVLRDPVDRIRSHYQHRVAIGTERAPIEEAVIADPVYLACSRYASQIERYLECFPRERLLLLTSEQLRTERLETMRRVFGFLGVDEQVVPSTLDREYYRTEGRATYPPIVGKLRHALKEHVPAAKRAKEFVDSTLPLFLGRSRPETGGSQGSRSPASVSVPAETRRELFELLRDDVDRLGRYITEGTEGWSIRPPDRSLR